MKEALISQLSKNRGKDLILGIQKAKNKLINSDYSYSILKENETLLRETSEKNWRISKRYELATN